MSSHHAQVVLFDVIVLLSILLFVFTLAPTVFSKKVHRSIGWYNLMAAWSVYSLTYGLLIGNQETPGPPPFGICLGQTIVIYGVPSLVAAGMVCYYIEFYLVISGLKYGHPRQPSTLRTFCLVVTPWLVFLSIVLEILLLVFPGKRAHLVERAEHNFYCHLNDNIPTQVTGAVVSVAMIILIPLEVWTGIMIFRNWAVFKRLSQADRRVYLTVYFRLILCSVGAMVAFAFSMLGFIFPEPDATSLVYPALSIFILLAFGTQKDLLQAWLFWRSSQPYASMIFNTGTVSTSTNFYTSQGVPIEIPVEPQPEVQMYKLTPTADSLETTTILPDTPSSTSTVMKADFGTSSQPSSSVIVHPEPAQIRLSTEEVAHLGSELNEPHP